MHLNNTKVSYLRKTSSIVVHCKSNEAMPSSTLLSSRWENMCGNEPELSKGRMYVICVPTLLSTLHWGTYPLIMWVTASLLNLISFEILRWYPVPEQIYKTSKSLEQIITPELPTFLGDILDHKVISQTHTFVIQFGNFANGRDVIDILVGINTQWGSSPKWFSQSDAPV